MTMFMKKLNVAGATVLAAAALITNTLAAQSTFVSPSGSIAFGISIPDDTSNEDIYFSLAFPYGETWAAVGLGNDEMKGTLVLMAYASANAENVTFSPRLANSETEPKYYSDLEYETITNSTGLMNASTFVYSAVCHNCRNWPNGGKIDVNSTTQKFIFATGPFGDLTTNNQKESVRKHDEHGVFTMNLQQATGEAGPVTLNSSTVDNGATLVGKVTENDRDWVAVFHAVIMVGCFVGLLPLGVLLLKFGKWVRWHGVNQGLALVVIIVGFGLGVKTGTLYNRSRNFNTAHQIIGLLVFIFLLAQFTLGYMHHRVYKKTQQKTKLAPVHTWLGRLVIVLGVFNGFLGFPLALNSTYNYALGGIILALVGFTLITLLIKRCIDRRIRRMEDNGTADAPLGYQPEPWLAAGQAPGQGLGQAPSNAASFEMGSLRKQGSATVSESRAPPPYS